MAGSHAEVNPARFMRLFQRGAEGRKGPSAIFRN
jgi:hypothetical protein